MSENDNAMSLEDALKAIADEMGIDNPTLEIETEDEPPSVEVIEAWVIATRPYIEKIIGIYPSEATALEKLDDLHRAHVGLFRVYKAKATVWFDPTE